MAGAEMMIIEVAYAKPGEQVILSLQVPLHTTLEEGVRRSGILERFPEIDLQHNRVGIFGKLAKLDATLQKHDRIEIYRALIADPKEVRKQRAADSKRNKQR